MNISSLAFATLALLALTAPTGSLAQQASTDAPPQTDSSKISSALRGGPSFVTEQATILDWPNRPDGEFRVLREGTSAWTCLAGLPHEHHDEPGCYDPMYLQWIKDTFAGRVPSNDKVGISYMYMGKFVPNTSRTLTNASEFRVGPHIMIVVPHADQASLEGMSTDGSNGQAYVSRIGKTGDLYLVIPISQWPSR